MPAASSRLSDLIALAEQPSSERRRELLRSVTDMFFAHDGHGAGEMALFDEVMNRLAGDMETAVRAELSQRLAAAPAAPSNLLRSLASDHIDVARPVLEQSASLSDADLVHVARTQGQEHLRAISQRPAVSTSVTDVIVERGDDNTLGVLLTNEGATLSREAHEKVVDRAAANPALHDVVTDRQSLPIDLLNDMYFMVEAQLRDRIMARNATIDPAELEAALEAGRKRVATQDGALPVDYAEAEAYIRAMKARGDITPRALAAMLRNREMTRFLLALAELAEIDFHTAKRIIDRRELDALAIVCKAADFDRSLFLTFAVLILDRDTDAMGKAKTYGELYAALPRETATRTVRFWRMRRTTGDVAAA